MKKQNIEVEGGEILIMSKEGHYAVIPAKHRQEVMDMIKDGCDNCINNYIQTLPKDNDYAEDGSLLPDWDEVKSVLNPKNWGVKDYTDKGSYEAAFAAARKAGEKEFMWNNKRFNTRKDTDEIKVTPPKDPYLNPNMYRGKTYSDYIKSNYPEFFKLINRGEGLSNIIFEGHRTNPTRGFYKRGNNTISVGENTDMTDDIFIGTIIAEMAHQKDPDKNKVIGSWTKNTYYDRRRYGENRYNIEGTLEYNTHRLYEPGLAMIAFGDLSPNDIKRIQKYLGVNEDGYFGENTYKALVNKYKDSEYIKYAIMRHQLYSQDKDKYPIFMGDYSGLAKAYLHQLNQDVPLRDAKRFFDISQYSNYTDEALLNIIPGSGDYDVGELQRILKSKGYKLPKSTKKDGSLDGVWGDETKAALLDYQNKMESKKTIEVEKNINNVRNKDNDFNEVSEPKIYKTTKAKLENIINKKLNNNELSTNI